MRTSLSSFTILAAALTLTAAPAFAEGTGTGTPPGPGAHQQPPPAPPIVTPAPTPEARKEEDAEKAKASLIARLKAHIKGTGAMANDIAGLQQQITTLQARIQELESGAVLKALQDENASMRADIAEFMAVAQTHGLLTESATAPDAQPSPKTPMGKAAAQVVAGAVSTQIAALGISAANLPPADQQHRSPGATLAEIEEALKAAKTPQERQALLQQHAALILRSN